MAEDTFPSFSHFRLQWHLQELDKEEMQTFKELLKEKYSEVTTCSLPEAAVDGAGVDTLAGLLHEHYLESLAWAISINIFEEMNMFALSERAQDEVKRYSPSPIPEDPKPTTDDPGVCEEDPPETSQAVEQDSTTPTETEERGDPWNYKAHVRTRFVEELATHCRLEGATAEWPEMQELLGVFSRATENCRPRTVVLHGKPGTGKSTLARRLMLSWAQGQLHGDFAFVFFLSAGELRVMEDSSLATIIAREWPSTQAPVAEIMSQPERLLLVLDGFDDLALVPNDENMQLCSNWAQEQPGTVLVHSLLRKVLLPSCSLLVTVGDAAMEKLKSLVVSPQYLLVSGLSLMQRTQWLLEHAANPPQRTHTLQSLVDSPGLLDLCQAPATCSLVCTALRLQEEEETSCSSSSGPRGGRTLTGLYTTLLLQQLAPQDILVPSLGPENRAILQGLCHVAMQGMWNMTPMIPSDTLRVHGLQETQLSTLFPGLLQGASRGKGCCAFLHTSLQALLTALHYVTMGRLEGPLGPSLARDTRSYMELSHLDLSCCFLWTRRFLFGLLGQKVTRALDVLLGRPEPQGLRQRLLHWVSLLGPLACTPGDTLESFYCLFEMQDADLVHMALRGFRTVRLLGHQRLDLRVASFCVQHCRHLREIQMDVTEVFSGAELTEACPQLHQQPQRKAPVDKRWEDFCSVLGTHPSLRQLDLGNSILSEGAVRTLCGELRRPTCKIQKLICRSAEVALPGLRHFWLATIASQHLRHLHLGNICLGPEDVRVASEALRHPRCRLETLRLDSCGLVPACCPTVSQILGMATSLKSISLARNKVTDKGLKILCEALRTTRSTLTHLILENCGLTGVGCEALALALSSSWRPTHLSLSNNCLGSEGLSLLCRALRHSDSTLQRLRLDCCGLDVAACGFLAFVLMSSQQLMHLSLSRNPVGDSGVQLLCEALRDPSCTLQDLELVECCLTEACCKDLSYVLTRSEHLQSLDLAANRLGDSGGATLCEGLRHRDSPLKRLGLEACGLADACCKVLSSALSGNQHLISLNLLQNDFGPSGVMELCAGLLQPTCDLRLLGLWKRQYPAQTRELLAKVQSLKPHLVISGSWYAFDDNDRYWWKH